MLPAGIAITGGTGLGVWQYLNGTIWTALPALPASSAFLLPSNALVRFDPANTLAANGSATLTYLAWDPTARTADTLFALAAQDEGGTGAFSTAVTAAAATMPINANTADLTKTGAGGITPFSATPLTAICLVNSAPMLT